MEPDWPHRTAVFTQVAPGGHTNEWPSRRVQRPRKQGGPPVPVREKFRHGHRRLAGGTQWHWNLGGWDAVRHANMEAISILKDENPDSKAVSLNLPGDSALEVDVTSGKTFPDLFPPPPPLAESSLGPFVDEEDLLEHCWHSHFPCVQGEGGHSESRGSPCYTL